MPRSCDARLPAKNVATGEWYSLTSNGAHRVALSISSSSSLSVVDEAVYQELLVHHRLHSKRPVEALPQPALYNTNVTALASQPAAHQHITLV
jgi:hypothetical protein